MDEQPNQLAFSFNENPVDNQVVDGGALKSNAIPPPFVENDESDNETSLATNTTQKKIMNLYDEGQPCGSNGCSVAAKTKAMPPPPPKDFLEQPIPVNPTSPFQHLASYFEKTVNKGGSKKSTPSPIATVNKPVAPAQQQQQQINQQQRQLIQQQRQLTQKLQATQQASAKRLIQQQQQQLAQQQQQLVHQQQQLTQQQQAAQQASAKKSIQQQKQVAQQQQQVAQQQQQIAQQQKQVAQQQQQIAQQQKQVAQQQASAKKFMYNATAPVLNNQHQSAALPPKKTPPSPMFAKGAKPVAPPKNNPPAQQQQQQQAAPLPVVNQGMQQQQQQQADQLIRPTSRMSSKVIYPSLLWDGSITITNMKKATGVSNNKNYLQNNIAPTPYVQIYQMFPQFENVEFLRYLIGQEGIFLSYLLPRSSNARNQWKYNLTHDPEFYNRVIAYNEEQKKIMAEMNGITVEEVNNQINSILQAYLAINADKLNKKFSFGCKKQYNPYNKMFFSNNSGSSTFNSSPFNLPKDVTFSNCSGSSCPTVNGVDLNNCLNNNPQFDGFRRVVYSTNPCAVMYQKIENESDLQQCMIGSMSAIQRVASDEDCVVKYNMIKDFLDETGYHLVKNSKPKNKKKSRKN